MKTHPLFLSIAAVCVLVMVSANGADLPLVRQVDWQPFSSQVKRIVEATDLLGAPFTAEEKESIAKLIQAGNSGDALAQVQQILDRHCLFGLQINPEMRVKVAQGAAKPELVEQGWRVFLVKVQNDSGATADLRAVSPNAVSLYEGPPANSASDKAFKSAAKPQASERWLELQTFDSQPLNRRLSGLALDYRILQIYSRDAGKREARISFNIGQGTQDLGF